MNKGITADNVRLKRAYERAVAADGTRILIDRLWPRGVKKADAAIDQGQRISLPVPNCANGSGTTPAAGKNSAVVTLGRCTSTRTNSTSCARWQDGALSHSSSPPTKRFTTTPLRSATFY
jgi:hypothetical protein